MNVVAPIMAIVASTFVDLWFTPDQQGDRLFRQKEFAEAAEAYRDPMRVGVAWFRAGDFEKAEQAFARVGSAEAEFNRGNALVFRGEYEAAIRRYDRALELRPGWGDAEVNRRVARARAEQTKREGGDMGDQKLGADEIVFDKDKKPGGQETEVEGAEAATDQNTQAIWLQRMQTRPADFLKAKFAYQKAIGGEEEAPTQP